MYETCLLVVAFPGMRVGFEKAPLGRASSSPNEWDGCNAAQSIAARCVRVAKGSDAIVQSIGYSCFTCPSVWPHAVGAALNTNCIGIVDLEERV